MAARGTLHMAWGLLPLLLAALAPCHVHAQNATAPCLEGWSGPGCQLCTSAAACAASTGVANATCSTDLAFAPSSQLKSWSCALPSDNSLASLLDPGSLLLQCSTGLAPGQILPDAAAVAAGAAAPPGNCSIGFRLASNKLEVKCSSSSCTLKAGQTSLECANITCACSADVTCGGDAGIAGLVRTISGGASLVCSTDGTCNMKMSTLLNVNATCSAAECLTVAATGSLAPVPQPSLAASPPAASPVPLPSPSPAAEQPQPPAEAGTCNPKDWEGNGCSLCKTDFACMTGDHTGAGNTAATCSRDFRFASNTMLKSWSCDNVGPGTLLSGRLTNLLVQCRTGLEPGTELPATAAAPAGMPPPASSPPAPEPAPAGATQPQPQPLPAAPAPAPGPEVTQEGVIDGILDSVAGRRRRLLAQPSAPLARTGEPLCQITFDTDVEDKPTSVQCTALDCSFVPGSSNLRCGRTTCECPASADCNGNTLVKSLAGSVAGAAELKCPAPPQGEADVAARPCTLQLEGMLISEFDATCQAGECLVPTSQELNATGNGSPLSGSEKNTNPVIAAVPLMVLVVIAVAVGTYTYTQRSMWGYRISGADLAQLERLAAKPSLVSHRVEQLEFENLTVSVPLSSKEAQQKAAALRRKAMQRTASHSTALGELHSSSGLARLLLAAKSKLRVPAGHLIGGAGAGRDLEQDATEQMQRSQSADEAAASVAAADFVVGLHQPLTQADRWYILSGCSGTLRSGEVVGVLGPSGCGKTTLLGSLAGSASDLGSGTLLSGSVQVDGHRRHKSQVAYVPQSDMLIPSLTVQECLRYSALLRLPQDTSPLDLQVHIERVLDELGLRHVADAQVGGSGGIRGVSGGERRRVTIGMELVTDPSILILDEPTSGLDSYTADNLLRSLKAVASAGRVVVASLHQPSRDVFTGLDQVMLMGHGRMLYMGPPGEAEGWFERHGLPCPPGTAIAEHMLRVASHAPSIRHLLQALEQEGYKEPGSPRRASSAAALLSPLAGGGSSSGGGSEDGESPLVVSSSSGDTGEQAPAGAAAAGACAQLSISKSPFAAAACSPQGRPAPCALGSATSSQDTEVPAGQGSKAAVPAASGHHKPHRRHARYGRQLSVMFWRTLVDIVRNPALLLLHSVVAVAMGLVTGLVFFQSDLTNVGVQNRMGGTFFALAFLGFTSLTTVDLLIAERQVVTREVRGGYYNPSAYLVSKLTLDAILLRVIPAILYFFPFYYLTGFQTESALAAAFCFILVTFSCVVGAMSMSVTVASNTAGQASFAMNFLLLFSLVFTGFLVNVDSIPGWIRWIHYLSVFYYAFEAMITGEVNGMVFEFQASGSAAIPNVKGEVFLQTLGFKPEQTTTDIGVLVGFYFLMVLTALALFYLRLPRQVTSSASRHERQPSSARRMLSSGSQAVGAAVRSASGRLRVSTSIGREAAYGEAATGSASEVPAAAAAGGSGGAPAGGSHRRWQLWNPAYSSAQPSAPPHPRPDGKPAAAAAEAAGPPSSLQTGLTADATSTATTTAPATPELQTASGVVAASARSGQQQPQQEAQKRFRQDFKAAP